MPDYRSAITDFQRQTLLESLLCLGGLAWTGLLLTDAYAETVSQEIAALVVAVELVIVVAYWLHSKWFHLSVGTLIVGLWLCNVAMLGHSPMPLYFYLFAPLALLTYTLSNGLAALGIALASSLVLALRADQSILDPDMLSPLAALWITVAIGMIVVRELHGALDMSSSYQQYAIEQMNKARAQRAELARLTQALSVAQERRVHANSQLIHARNLAEESRQIKARFAANVSHELRTPINLIVGFSEMLSVTPEAYGEALPPAFRADIHAIYRNAQHLQKLINDILDISQIEAGRMSILKEDTHPAAVLRGVAELARDLIESKGLTLNVDLADDLPVLLLDRTRISQVVLNLLANAARFTEQGSITLKAERGEACVVITVRDTGVGIPEDDLERVFEEFYHLVGKELPDRTGTGLGLTLSREFVRLHGGTMTVASAGIPGQGSAFLFTLPVPDSLRRSPAQTARSAPLRGKDCIVVVDEDPAVLQLFKGYITRHNVMTYQTTDEAIQCVREIGPMSVIFGETGDSASLVAAVREHSPHTALIACPMPSGRRLMQAFGVSDYLIKPVSRQALLEAMRQLPPPVARVLIIDDNLDVCRMFSQMLQTAGQAYVIEVAHNGKEGLTAAQRTPPDAVILDILMPDLDGFAVIQQMKRNPALAEIPIVVVSARGASEAVASEVWGEITIQKLVGFQPIELVNCVDSVVAEFMASAGQ
jgi:signal transduction histidine kinase/CheY-like chemotaxis protein